MNSKWQTVVPALVLSLWAVVLAHPNVNAETTNGFVGTVTMCQGTSWLRRGEKTYTLVRAAGIRVGDAIETSGDATIALALDDGPVIAVAAQSYVVLTRTSSSWEIHLVEGETRCIHDGNSLCDLLAGKCRVSLERSIVQLDSRQQHVTAELVAGSAKLKSGRETRYLVPNGLSVQVDGGGTIRRGGASAWRLQSAQIRLAAAMQTAPPLETPPADVAPPVTPPEPVPPSDDVVLDEPMPPPFEQLPDDDLLGLGQDPFAAATRGGDQDDSPDDDSQRVTTNSFAGSPSLSLGSFFGSTGSIASGFANNDANQQTFQGMLANGDPFPGAIHLVTSEQRYDFNNVMLTMKEAETIFPGGGQRKYYSVGEGAPPTGQVLTNFFTGTGATPTTVAIPRFGLYLLHLDQYNYPDPADPDNGPTGVGITGLLGDPPTSPTIIGATPLADERSPSQLNPNATFALGEFLVQENGNGIVFAIRRSDQDRLIVKDAGGNDANDSVTPNSDVTFVDAVDPRFLPQSPTVKEPDTYTPSGTTLRELNLMRRAAFTTLVADQLQEFSRRTGQTRFVVDGRIVDISGFQPTR